MILGNVAEQAKDNLASVKLEPDDEEAKILDNFLNGK